MYCNYILIFRLHFIAIVSLIYNTFYPLKPSAATIEKKPTLKLIFIIQYVEQNFFQLERFYDNFENQKLVDKI